MDLAEKAIIIHHAQHALQDKGTLHKVWVNLNRILILYYNDILSITFTFTLQFNKPI